MIKRVIGLLSPRYIFRDAITGRYVTKLYALLHPSTTIRSRVDVRDSGDLR